MASAHRIPSAADQGAPGQLPVLENLIDRHPRLVALTGAGVSAASGIPTYRDDRGHWLRADPIQHQAFVTDPVSRRRYWARSMLGWRHVADSLPNAAHHALAALERSGHLRLLVTQNVDRLHQRAGHRRVVDLHGRIDRVICLDCGADLQRDVLQRELEELNGTRRHRVLGVRPDGDAEIADERLMRFRVPDCRDCGGILMPDVVFFGGTVPAGRVKEVKAAIAAADALLVAGSSLMVYSGFRFCRLAVELGKPLVIVNRGSTRGDPIAAVKISADCGPLLERLAQRLAARADGAPCHDLQAS